MLCLHPRLRVEQLNGSVTIEPLSDSNRWLLHDYAGARLGRIKRVDQVPCQNCLACRLAYAQDWACRMMMELYTPTTTSAYFVTLTYDDLHVKITDGADPRTGEYRQGLTLDKRDVQLWFKRLRKACPGADIRYLVAGEYGDQSGRPHYHCALYNCPLTDLVFDTWSDKCGVTSRLYRSKLLTDTWGMGNVLIGDLNERSCGYIARYIVKKHKGKDADIYNALNIVPEFILSSRRPALGLRYLEDHAAEIAERGTVVFATDLGRKEYPVPRYVNNKLLDPSVSDAELYAQYKEQRYFHNLDDQMYDIMLNDFSDDLSYAERQEVAARSQEAKLQILKRRLSV